MTFPDKERHQLFIEPMGLSTEELYVQGFFQLHAREVQLRMLHTVPRSRAGGGHAPGVCHRIRLRGPTELLPTLETRKVAGLWALSSTAPRATRPPSRVSARA